MSAFHLGFTHLDCLRLRLTINRTRWRCRLNRRATEDSVEEARAREDIYISSFSFRINPTTQHKLVSIVERCHVDLGVDVSAPKEATKQAASCRGLFDVAERLIVVDGPR